ncbi:MAG TPA: hypothetical protein VFX38_00400, partial [Gammaproteobacteria bacterium]|nr:hypothetical protein [Gammaproteobacteria bacterium]
MRNCLILGSGRSGTSMLGGVLNAAGYYMGEKLYRARDANPRGFFEAPAINSINEHLLRPHAASRCPYPLLRVWRSLFSAERWLARIPLGTQIASTPKIAGRIAAEVARRPFAFKDPRFCYTLPAWRPQLPPDTVFLCIFREPGRTAASILRERRRKYPDLRLRLEDAFGVWNDMYQHVLRIHRHSGRWLFIHYDQMINGAAISAVEKLLGVHVDASFPDVAFDRASPIKTPAQARATYREL